MGSTAWGLYWLLAGFVLIACGFLNIFAPSLMTRWQVQSTEQGRIAARRQLRISKAAGD